MGSAFIFQMHQDGPDTQHVTSVSKSNLENNSSDIKIPQPCSNAQGEEGAMSQLKTKSTNGQNTTSNKLQAFLEVPPAKINNVDHKENEKWKENFRGKTSGNSDDVAIAIKDGGLEVQAPFFQENLFSRTSSLERPFELSHVNDMSNFIGEDRKEFSSFLSNVSEKLQKTGAPGTENPSKFEGTKSNGDETSEKPASIETLASKLAKSTPNTANVSNLNKARSLGEMKKPSAGVEGRDVLPLVKKPINGEHDSDVLPMVKKLQARQDGGDAFPMMKKPSAEQDAGDLLPMVKKPQAGECGGDVPHRIGKQISLINFSRATTEKIILGATDFSKTVGGAMREFCSTTTAHGFRHMVTPTAPWLVRVFWGTATMLCLAFMAQLSFDATKSAFVLRRPYSEVAYVDKRLEGMVLPHITVCDHTGFHKSKMAVHGVSAALASYILIALHGASIMSVQFAASATWQKTSHLDLTTYLKAHNVTLEQLVLSISPQCTDVVLGCFTPEHQMLGSDCCEKMFRASITSTGVCFSTLGFDSFQHTQHISGIMGGLKILFYNDVSEYMDFSPTIVSAYRMSSTGVSVSLSGASVTPTVAFNTHAVSVAPGSSAALAVQVAVLDKTETFMGIWPGSKRACADETELSSMHQDEFLRTQDNVYWTILYRDCPLASSRCSSLPFRVQNDTTEICLPDDLIRHSYASEEQNACTKRLLWQSYGDMGSRPLCVDRVLTQQLSYTDLNVSRVLDRTVSSNLKPSLVNIYYTQLGYTQYQQRLPTFATWFSDLGGQMGLFLGASILTIVELSLTAIFLARTLLKAIFNRVSAAIRRKKTEAQQQKISKKTEVQGNSSNVSPLRKAFAY